MMRIVNASGKLIRGKRAYTVSLLCAAVASALPAQTFTTLYSFDNADGAGAAAALVQGADGNLYGTTGGGGASDDGTIFKITPSGTLTTLYSFCPQLVNGVCTDGEAPFRGAGLVQATDGNFYGTTPTAGANASGGTVYKITPSGRLTTLYSFCSQSGCTDGAYPNGRLVQATDGNFYGITNGGGAVSSGTVFKITPSGALTTLYSFCAQLVNGVCADGSAPEAGLVQASDGDFYGTTSEGGANFYGTAFKITPGGALTTLYSFCALSGCTDGSGPDAGLVQATDGNFYGTTPGGGANNLGTVFKITPGGALTTLYSFCSHGGSLCTDGETPPLGAALIQATDGNFYGTTNGGGAYAGGGGGGTIFKITPSGTLTTLYSFCAQSDCNDGSGPQAGLVQAANGDFYGTTYNFGANGFGTVFSLSVGLGPSVPAVGAGGVVNSGSYTAQGVAPGSLVSIFGTNLAASTSSGNSIPLPTALSDVTSVTFNGIPAGLYFVSSGQINAQLPFNVPTGTADIVVNRSSGASAPQSVNVVPASPGIFTTNAEGTGQAFAYDNTTGDLAAPAGAPIGVFHTAPISVSLGHALIIACTGLGSVTPAIDNYVAASEGGLRNTVLTPVVTIGGVTAKFVYSVLSPQFVSEYQIGVVPDPATPTGNAVSLQIQIGGVTTTDQVTIAIAP